MIVGSLMNAHIVGLLSQNPTFGRVFTWLNINLDCLTDGITVLDGKKLYVNVHGYTTRVPAECAWESHRNTIDLQMMLRGAEVIDWAEPQDGLLSRAYDSERDFETWPENIIQEGSVTMRPGVFAIFLPGELHRPMVAVHQPEAINKLVVKIDAGMIGGSHV